MYLLCKVYVLSVVVLVQKEAGGDLQKEFTKAFPWQLENPVSSYEHAPLVHDLSPILWYPNWPFMHVLDGGFEHERLDVHASSLAMPP